MADKFKIRQRNSSFEISKRISRNNGTTELKERQPLEPPFWFDSGLTDPLGADLPFCLFITYSPVSLLVITCAGSKRSGE